MLKWLAAVASTPTPDDYWRVGFIVSGIVVGVIAIIKGWMWFTSYFVTRKDYDRDVQERDHRVLTDTQRDDKFAKQVDRLIDAIKHKR